MIRQAVRTLTGRADGDPEVNPYDDELYLRGNQGTTETDPVEDGPQDDQVGLSNIQATVDRLSQNYEELQQRLADKDRFIGQLQGENQTLRSVMPNTGAGRQPQQEPDPVLDESTAQLFTEKYKDEPEKALVALAEYLDQRQAGRVAQSEASRNQADQQAAYMQAVERNILRQVDLAIHNLGDEATPVVEDFLNQVRSGTGSAQDYASTWLGRQLMADSALATSTQGVYRLIELEAMKRRGNTPEQEPAPQAPSAPASVARPTAPHRPVAGTVNPSDEIPMEDRIGDAIVQAARGDDAQIEAIFRG